MIIEKMDTEEWELRDDRGVVLKLPVSELQFLHRQIEEKLMKNHEGPVYTFTFYDRLEALRALKSLDYILALCDLEEKYRAWYKWGMQKGETFDIEMVRDNFTETLSERNIDLWGELE